MWVCSLDYLRKDVNIHGRATVGLYPGTLTKSHTLILYKQKEKPRRISCHGAEAFPFEPYLSAHTFQSLADGINIRSPIQQPAGGTNIRSSISATCRRSQHPSTYSAACCRLLPEQMESTPHKPDGRGIEQQETFACYNGMEVPGQDLEHGDRSIDRSEGTPRERRDVYNERS